MRICALLTLLFFSGCTSLQRATLPAQPSSAVLAPPDTHKVALALLPVVLPPDAVPTQPLSVEVQPKTSDWASLVVGKVEVDRSTEPQRVRITYERNGQTLQETYKLPVFGERLVLFPRKAATDSADAQAFVAGRPAAREVSVDVHDEGWSLKDRLALLGAAVLIAVVGYFALKLWA
ncbi:hypothetical protein [Salisaeta icosahedral phage 1]|uniref:hypothetical protein n=1 Tax=Salisaeta icosahedral phage 1 TaxID=1183239 RepID=UPI00025EA93F|nr:hypothetical protein A322_gp50 [Salisaeta icosahedral phage 1]AFJ21505.1 hypothetical protein [Salisaeta icosahedral phage 1]